MVTDTPLKFAVIGHPIAHSRSPAIHAAFADQLGIRLVYERIDSPPTDFALQVHTFFNNAGVGLNVTVPFKEQAWQMARDHLSKRALDAGAVNTLWMVNNKIHGCNTDGIGLVNDLKRLGMPLEQANILLVGAGGAARGVLGPILAAGCSHIRVINRTAARAHELVAQWIATHPQDTPRLSAGSLSDTDLTNKGDQSTEKQSHFDLVINATASSLQGERVPLADSVFAPGVYVYDMMYGKDLTAFLKQATQAGSNRVADGLGMLVSQACESFRIWHGKTPNPEPVIAQIRADLNAATVR